MAYAYLSFSAIRLVSVVCCLICLNGDLYVRHHPCQRRQSLFSLTDKQSVASHLPIFRLIAHHAHRPGGYPYPVCGTRNAASTRPATQGRLGQVHGMPCSNSVISEVREVERYLLLLTLHQSLMVFPVRISLLSRSYYITNLGLDSNQHTHLSQCVRPSVIYQFTTSVLS